ncbi:cysteine dioxygenase [Neptunomonas antarctica]|uniref:Predicted metal-dependent enzyme of the double-stranded beta helix superfamily n=1 Tax=Neptunomonas antarctica TaxID=619304 RepID=A0A1N7LQN3_9GAMM|nr:cysteine dioxygenase [Neptunomonas antarctica]SIS76092.1 Predicted metal-dependent enzyme of the double-stranded beta helix superfamily [Neptunomonas antarctica]
MQNLTRLKTFIQEFTRLVDRIGDDEQAIFVSGKSLLQDLVLHDDWLPEDFAKADLNRYQQYLLHCDPLERFSIASFVWGPGQCTPIHDHTVWGMVGVMRGGELCEEFCVDDSTGLIVAEGKHLLEIGGVDLVSPQVGDIHRVSNSFNDQVSISIHIYGANIGIVNRHTYDLDTGNKQLFVSGYSNPSLPNVWG